MSGALIDNDRLVIGTEEGLLCVDLDREGKDILGTLYYKTTDLTIQELLRCKLEWSCFIPLVEIIVLNFTVYDNALNASACFCWHILRVRSTLEFFGRPADCVHL